MFDAATASTAINLVLIVYEVPLNGRAGNGGL